ncbi:MAG: DUF2442 domain-containing protein [Acidobacteriota bacterium]|nr:DUF2442 domain-containing protein [Acidobacteriota bacterium]
MAIKGGKWEMSDDEFDRQFAEATERGKAEMASGVYAAAARYDKAKRRLVVDLANGMTLLIPTHLLEGLQLATAKELAEVEILGAGSGLYWPKLNLDIALAGLLGKILEINGRVTELGRFGAKVPANAKRAA